MQENKYRHVRTLAIGFVAVLLFLLGFLSAEANIFPYKKYVKKLLERLNPSQSLSAVSLRGRWHIPRSVGLKGTLADHKRQEALIKLSTLGYLGGYTPATDEQGVTVYDEKLAYSGLNLLTSGHLAEAILTDMKGNILHRWRKDISEVDFFRQLKGKSLKRSRIGDALWLHVELGRNGELLAVFEGIGIVKLDRASNVMWSYLGRNHHDLDVAKNGTIYLLGRQLRPQTDKMHLFTWTSSDTVIADDLITVLTPDGEEVKRISVLDCFLNSQFSSMLEHIKRKRDVLHTNSITLIEDDRLASQMPAFRKGTALISMRAIHTIAVIDLAKEQVIWAMTGMWKFQHDPVILENGNILIFDNLGNFGSSRVLEVNPMTQEVVWKYGDTPAEEFVTVTCGGNQRLPNGNTLITESENGRAFEVTPAGRIVWEYRNPHRAGKNGELVATLFKVLRIEPETVNGFLGDLE